jgi:hypothetical protein
MKEALKLALEALERSVATCFDQYAHQQVMSQPDHFINKAITALRLAIDVQNMASESTYKEALTQPEQEPVAYFNPQVKGGFYWAKPTKITAPITVSVEPMPLYTTPTQRTWVGLTPDEIRGLSLASGESLFSAIMFTHDKLKEKNNV